MSEFYLLLPYVLTLSIIHFIITSLLLYRARGSLFDKNVISALTFYTTIGTICVAIYLSISEEFIFRFLIKKYVIDEFTEYKFYLKILFSVLFGLVHLLNYFSYPPTYIKYYTAIATLVQVIFTSLLGYILYNCNDFNNCMKLHICYNFCSILNCVVQYSLKVLKILNNHDRVSNDNNFYSCEQGLIWLKRRHSFHGFKKLKINPFPVKFELVKSKDKEIIKLHSYKFDKFDKL